MATCKDCLHYKMCQELEDSGQVSSRTHSHCCGCFIDSSKFVKLPCKVGDTVYLMVKYNKDKFGHYYTGIVSGIHITDKKSNDPYSKRFDYLVVRFPATDSIKHINFKEIGKTVFLTFKEAEKALKEHKNNV